MDQRSIELLEFPAIRARLAAATSFGPSRRLAEALEPSSDPVLVARGLDETDQALALLQERPGRRDRCRPRHRPRRSSGRPAAAAWIRPSSSRSPTTLDATARLATLLADERRPLLRELGRELHAAAGAALDAGPQLRPGRRAARHRVAAARRPALGGPGRLRPAAPAARRARRLGARQRPPGADHHAAQRPLRGPGQGRGAVEGQGHRPRRLGQRRRRCSSSRWSRSSWATPGARRRSPRPRRSRASSTSCRRSSPPTPSRCARRSRRWPSSTSGRPRRRSPSDMRASRAETTGADRGDPAVGAPPGPDRHGSSRSTSGSATATPRSS